MLRDANTSCTSFGLSFMTSYYSGRSPFTHHSEFYHVLGAQEWAGIAQSVYRLGWTVWGSNSGEGEIFRTRPDRPWGPPSLLYNGYRILPGGKAVGAWR